MGRAARKEYRETANRIGDEDTLRVYPGRRIRTEAIEEPSAARAFDWVTRMPQYRFLQHLFASKVLSHQGRGRVIDLGCGSGGLAITLAKMHPFIKVVGLDLSDEMLELAKRRATEAGIAERIIFEKGNAQQIRYSGNSFDLVVSTLSLHHWSRPIKVFDEVARILKPGGKCVLADMRRDPIPLFTGFLWFVTHFIVQASLRRVGEPLGSLQSAYTREETSSLLRKSMLGSFCRVTDGPCWILIKGRKN